MSGAATYTVCVQSDQLSCGCGRLKIARGFYSCQGFVITQKSGGCDKFMSAMGIGGRFEVDRGL